MLLLIRFLLYYSFRFLFSGRTLVMRTMATYLFCCRNIYWTMNDILCSHCLMQSLFIHSAFLKREDVHLFPRIFTFNTWCLFFLSYFYFCGGKKQVREVRVKIGWHSKEASQGGRSLGLMMICILDQNTQNNEYQYSGIFFSFCSISIIPHLYSDSLQTYFKFWEISSQYLLLQ